MIPVIINKINRAEFRKYYEQRRVMNKGESRTIKASPKIYWVRPSWCCLFMVLASRGPRRAAPAGQRPKKLSVQCPGDQAQGHREGKSSKSLPFECNLNVAGGRAKFAAAWVPETPGPRGQGLGLYNCLQPPTRMHDRAKCIVRTDMVRSPLTGRLALRLWRLNFKFILYDTN